MKHNLVILFVCLASQAFSQQGICGKVTWIAGNQMPGPDKEIEKPEPVVRLIHVHEVTTSDQVVTEDGLYKEIKTKLVAKAKSDTQGRFKISLPPGEYSVFIKEADGWFAKSFDDQGRIQTVTVKPKKYAEMDILVDYLASY
jgi:hypothetical protein